jgi:hypothetical protein
MLKWLVGDSEGGCCIPWLLAKRIFRSPADLGKHAGAVDLRKLASLL